jgi:hypothetical protein
MKFATLAAFLKTLNQWVNDGSKIIDISTSPVGESAILLGKDGAKEYLVFFYSDEDFEDSDLFDGEESVKSDDAWRKYAAGDLEYADAVALGGPLPEPVPQSPLDKNIQTSIERFGHVVVDEFSDEELTEIEKNPKLAVYLIPDENVRVSKIVAPANALFGDIWRQHLAYRERDKSKSERIIDQIVDNQTHFRVQYANYLMSNPGFLATFDGHISIEFGDMELSTDGTSGFTDPNKFKMRFRQELTFVNTPGE